jgi:hypothetical protein
LVRGASQGAQDGDVDVVQKSVVSVGNGNDDLGPQLHTVEAHNLGGGQQQGEVGRQEDVHDAVRLAFDLNVGCEEAHLELGWVATGLNEPSIPDDVQFSDQAAEVALTDSSTMSHQDAGLRAVLGNAEGRINKDRQELGLPKNQGRGVPKFVAPLRKSLLCNPFVKTKPMSGKKTSTEGQQIVSFQGRSRCRSVGETFNRVDKTWCSGDEPEETREVEGEGSERVTVGYR